MLEKVFKSEKVKDNVDSVYDQVCVDVLFEGSKASCYTVSSIYGKNKTIILIDSVLHSSCQRSAWSPKTKPFSYCERLLML